MVAGDDLRMLVKAIEDYIKWAKSMEEQGRSRHSIRYSQVLNELLVFSINNNISWKDMFTPATLEQFCDYSSFNNAGRALIALSRHLFIHGRIDQPLEIPRPKKHKPLPDIYDEYLLYYEQSRQGSRQHLSHLRATLGYFHEYLETINIKLSSLNIKHVDTYMAKFKVAHNTLKLYRSNIRGFLRYLYYERGIIQKDLATLLVGPPLYAQTKPPKFLRPQEVKRLFAALKLSTPDQRQLELPVNDN